MEVRNEKYSACLRRGKITVVRLQQGKDRKLHWTFPSGGGASDASCVEIALDFLIYGTKNGDIVHYLLDEDAPLLSTTFHHSQGIKRLWVNVIGTRVILEDEMEHLFVYNPVSQETSLISETDNPDNVLWDSDDSNVVVISKGHEDMVFIYSSASVSPKLMFVGLSTTRPAGFVPLALQNGVLTSQGSAPVEEVILETHKWIKGRVESQAERRMRFDQNIALFHFKEAWNDAIVLNEKEVWDALAKQALEQMDLDLALKACQQAKDVKMQMLLRPLEHIEDKYLFAGHVMTIFGEHDTAQDYFLKSIHPQSAVDLRMSLQQWDRALPLAVQLDSPSIHDIKWHYAKWLERKGEYRQSVMHYQDTLKVCLPDTPRYSQAKAGLARALIHVGDIWKGKQLAIECNDTRLFGECAKILEGLNLLQDAAELYEMGKQPQKATRLYIAARNYSKACLLLKELDSLMFYNEYGRAMEGERKYSDASAAYEAGEDFENVVRLELGPLNNPSRAYSVVYETKSISGAFLAAKFCKGNGDYDRAIEFFIMAKSRRDEARELAQLHGKMDVYTGLVVDIASTEERLTLAKYYESTGNYTQAGLLFERCNETKKALNLYLQWGSPEGIDQAIAMVGRLKSEELISQLFDFLTDATRAEKTQKHLQRLHTVLGHYEQATKAAKLIADQEREAGNYRSGHQLLLDYCRTLQDHGKQVPSELLRQLMLLHSYILVKTLIRLENHRLSARMLIRIVKNISMFPAHVVQILTSAVIECQRSGLKKSAFDYASMLMNPEYRQMIAPAYKRKIEKIVRKPEKVEDEEPLSPCPVCSLPIPETQLDCPACGSNIPFCIVSGRHMVLEDWTTCPSCKFPALMSEFLKILEVEKTCPMCSQPVAEEDLVLVNPDLKK